MWAREEKWAWQDAFFSPVHAERERKGCVWCLTLSPIGRMREKKQGKKSALHASTGPDLFIFHSPSVSFFTVLLPEFLRAPTARDEIFILTPHILWDAPSSADGNRDNTRRLSFALASISSLAPASALCARCGRFFPLSPHQRSLFYIIHLSFYDFSILPGDQDVTKKMRTALCTRALD